MEDMNWFIVIVTAAVILYATYFLLKTKKKKKVVSRQFKTEEFHEEFEDINLHAVSNKDYEIFGKVGLGFENEDKNRFQNIIPYDKTRVKVKGDPDFYINANFITLGDKFSYIATQHPLPGYYVDFWEMVLHHKFEVVIAFHLVESYWGQVDSVGSVESMGDIDIKILKIQKRPVFTHRILQLTKSTYGGKEETIIVHHLYFRKWKDFSVPLYTHFRIFFEKLCSLKKSKMVTHCLAGVGRTGTFILSHHIIEGSNYKDKFKMKELTLKMRDDRIGMIQTEEQYIFVHLFVKKYQKEKTE